MRHIAERVRAVVQELYGLDISPEITRTQAQYGDYATNCAMQLSKQLQKNPREIADAIVQALPDETIASAAVAGPGFINLSVNAIKLYAQLHEAFKLDSAPFGTSNIGKGKCVVCEFPSPNMAKPFSVGHIRSGLQGWAVAQLMRRHGYTVVTDNHVGDSGTPFGKWVVGYLRYSSPEALQENGIHELSRVYIKITSEMKAEKVAGKNELEQEVQSWLMRLEQKEVEALGYSEQFNTISFDHMHTIMNRLGISTDYELGESQYVHRGQEMVNELLQKGVAVESNGAIIVDLKEHDIDTPIMLRKANGTALYATTDLATVEDREKRWHPVHVFIHTGQEQAFYFRQLNALSEKAGFDPAIRHLWHGLVDIKDEAGKREKMSSRKGVILLEQLLDVAEQKAKEYAKDGNEEDIKKISMAAIKFNDFTADRKNGVLFDWDTMFSVQGFSGPAVQYAAVRIQSILQKTPRSLDDISGYDWEAEKPLLLSLLEYPSLLEQLEKTYDMHKLALYVYELAREFNRYYEKERIVGIAEPDRSAKVWLISTVLYVLKDGLDILGIQIPVKM